MVKVIAVETVVHAEGIARIKNKYTVEKATWVTVSLFLQYILLYYIDKFSFRIISYMLYLKAPQNLKIKSSNLIVKLFDIDSA